MKKPKLTEEEIDDAIDRELTKRERDPQLRIAEALEQIAAELKTLNEHMRSKG